MEEQLEKELRFHIEQHTADLVARGLDPGEARRQANLTLGGPELAKEQCRDARGTRWLEDLLQDFRYALRTLGMILVGVGVGAAATLAAGRLLEHLVEGMQPTGPSTFGLMIPIFVLAALLASFLPARRASRIDPVTALRQE